MNPLDKEEFTAFKEIMNKEMPVHTINSARVKHIYGNFPKNFMEESALVDNKFLNNYQHIIEEISNRNKQNHFIKLFRIYQLDNYEKYGTLEHDCFYSMGGKILSSKHRGGSGLLLGQFILFGRVNGPELTGGGNTSTGAFNPSGFVYAAKTSDAGTVGHYYDEIAINCTSGNNGNMKAVIYDDDGGSPSKPNAPYNSGTGDFTSSSDFNYHTMAEFSLAGIQVWGAWQWQSSSNITLTETSSSNLGAFKSQSYGTFPTGGFTNGADQFKHKINHS